MIEFNKIFELNKNKKTLSIDLVIDEIYEGGNIGNMNDEVLSKLMGVGNAGGFRVRNIQNTNVKNGKKAFVVLYSSNEDLDWPDILDQENGKFKYYGDNKKPGETLGSTKGNSLLESVFNENDRSQIPPIFIFSKKPTQSSARSVKFIGLAVPEDYHLGRDNSLKAIWRTGDGGNRFINYEAHFTLLNTKEIKSEWLNALIEGDGLNVKVAPEAWIKYVNEGLTDSIILKAPKTKEIRSKKDQLPSDNDEMRRLEFIYENFQKEPTKFEFFAVKVVNLMDVKFSNFNVTRATKDGGIDAIGEYKLGHNHNYIKLRCALEAKCFNPNTGVGVKPISRLISRLRYRDFGIFVTTSFIHKQAYEEILEDKHPVILISGRDIIDILKINHINTIDLIKDFIEK